MKVIIAGGREFKDYKKLKKYMDFILMNIDKDKLEIVSGGARGADLLGEKYAEEKGYPVKQFIPDWGIGKQAGYLRNWDMAKYADALVAFHDGESKGTQHMINLAKKESLLVRIVNYKKKDDV